MVLWTSTWWYTYVIGVANVWTVENDLLEVVVILLFWYLWLDSNSLLVLSKVIQMGTIQKRPVGMVSWKGMQRWQPKRAYGDAILPGHGHIEMTS